MRPPRSEPRHRLPALQRFLTVPSSALLLAAGLCLPSPAEEKVWDGNSRGNDWSEGPNWTPPGAPVAGDDLRFPAGGLKPSNNNGLPAGTVLNRITYAAAGYTATGNEVGLTGGLLVSHGAGLTVVSLPLSLEEGQTFSVVEAGATLLLNGQVSLGRSRGALTFDGDGQVVVAGNISGTGLLGGLPGGAIRKTGAGTLWILQHVTYSGSTLVNGGTLRVGSTLSNSTVLLNAGGTLRGEGKVGGLTANAGGTVSPGGTSPDSLDVLGALTLNTGSTLNIRLNGTNAGLNYDQLDVRGTVTLAGTLAVTVGYGPDIGDTYTIVDNDGTDAVTGSFSGLPEGTKLLLGTQEYTISYTGGTGNDVVLRHGRPLWRFSVLAAVTDETATYYGGLGAIGGLISNQIATVNARFNGPNVFEGHFRFVVTSITEFSGSAIDEALRAHPDHDFKVVYDGFPTQGGGWFGDRRAIHHSWAVNNLGGPFASTATDGLVHEFGHSRGGIDLYALNVIGTNNPVNGQAFNAIPSIMHYPYGVSVWDEHSQHLINRNADTVAPPITYITRAFPASIRIRVTDAEGGPFPDVLVKLFPVPWYTSSVLDTPILSGRTDSNGDFLLPSNPFGPDTADRPWNLRYPNFLVSAVYGHTLAYAWMPLYDVQNAYFNAPFRGFRFTLPMSISTFDSWRLARFSAAELNNEALSGLFADPDGDRLNNLMEYALALDPHHPDPGPVLSYSLQDGDFAASYTRRKLSTAIDLTFLNQFTTDLRGGWGDAPIAQVTDLGSTERVRFTGLPAVQSPSAFFRLQVVHLP